MNSDGRVNRVVAGCVVAAGVCTAAACGDAADTAEQAGRQLSADVDALNSQPSLGVTDLSWTERPCGNQRYRRFLAASIDLPADEGFGRTVDPRTYPDLIYGQVRSALVDRGYRLDPSGPESEPKSLIVMVAPSRTFRVSVALSSEHFQVEHAARISAETACLPQGG